MIKITQRNIFAFGLLAIFVFAVFVVPVYAQADPSLGLDEFGSETQLGQRPLVEIIARVVNVSLSILGVVAVLLIIYGGWIWMTSGGNEEKIEQAKAVLRNAIIGLIIILSSYAIASFIIGRFQEAELITGAGGLSGNAAVALGPGSPGGLLEALYPEPGAEVCRNIQLMLQFKVPMDRTTLATTNGGQQRINASAIQVQVRDGSEPAVTNWGAAINDDGKIVVYNPLTAADYLGNATTATVYQVTFTNALRSAQGQSVFPLEYSYTFTVKPCIDTAPPQVSAFYPDPRAERYQDNNGAFVRNTAVVITFNKPVNPLTVAGSTAKLSVRANTANVAGAFGPPFDSFRSVRFTPAEKCGMNACGNDIYCLPANATVDVVALAASLSGANPSNPNEAAVASNGLPDGVVDGYRNSLDGGGALGADKNGQAEGPPQDNFSLSFKTSAAVDLSSPRIATVLPGRGGQGVSSDASVRANFSKPISQINSQLFFLDPAPRSGFQTGFAETAGQRDLQALALRPYGSLEPNMTYVPQATSGIEDVNFNCYLPCAGPGCVAIGSASATSDYDPPYRKAGLWSESEDRVIVYPSCSAFNANTPDTRSTTRLEHLRQLTAALAGYKKDKNAYPATPLRFDCYLSRAHYDDYIPELVPNYLAELPHDPASACLGNTNYNYGYVSDGKDYKVFVPVVPNDGSGFENCLAGRAAGIEDPARRCGVSSDPAWAAYTPGAATW